MPVTHIHWGPYVTASEHLATQWLLSKLTGASPAGAWYVVSNWRSSNGSDRRRDDLDIVVIGPTGVHLVEVKHWGRDRLDSKQHRDEVYRQAHLVDDKAKRLKSRIRRETDVDVYVAGKLLLTRHQGEKPASAHVRVEGIDVFGLTEWRELVDLDGMEAARQALTDKQVEAIVDGLWLRGRAPGGDRIRSFEGFADLRLESSSLGGLRNVYRAKREKSIDRVILTLYDLTVPSIEDAEAELVAKREWTALQALQKCTWLPSLVDSYQEASGYPGEVWFFSYADTEAPALESRAKDRDWSVADRVRTARQAVEGLLEIHGVDESGPRLHRNLSPQSIRVRSDGRPLFTQLHLAKLPGHHTVAGNVSPELAGLEPFVAPEVRALGLEGCSPASDTYSLCASLMLLFDQTDSDPLGCGTQTVLAAGLAEEPRDRAGLAQLLESLDSLLEECAQPGPPQAVPSVRPEFWDEDTVKELGRRRYRVLQRLGQGAIGTAFKVMEVDAEGVETGCGPFVAKVFANEDLGQPAIGAYGRARPHTGGEHLAVVFEVATQWSPTEIAVLLKWVPGYSLHDCCRLWPNREYLDRCEAETRCQATLTWFRDLCSGLACLHRAGLVHGDVSPRNIIVDSDRVTLTDFDLVAVPGFIPTAPGTIAYCAPMVESRERIVASDDVYALAAALFGALFEREPFEHNGVRAKSRGLNWEGIDRESWSGLAELLDKATHPDPQQRFADAIEARAYTECLLAGAVPPGPPDTPPEPPLSDNEVEWLDCLLRSYRGSPKGNDETRGLDSSFAQCTYVETGLDRHLEDRIRRGDLSLLVLCGNVGDGKTALLQHLGGLLEVEVGTSARRLWDCTLPNGMVVRANLDGSASYAGRSASDLLDEILRPFSTQEFPASTVHLLAVNDGPLLQWLDDQNEDHYGANQIRDALEEPGASIDQRIYFINFNARSLVGGCVPGQAALSTEFVDSLIAKMLGEGEDDRDHWRPCRTCTAQQRCPAWRSVQDLRAEGMGPVVRARLSRALQAVHLRGELHVTARELRGTLAYVLFGIHSCRDLHDVPALEPCHYWDRAFDPESPYRQLDLLTELSRVDPALGAHPRIDAELVLREEDRCALAGQDPSPLSSLRRKAYLTWPEAEVERIGGVPDALGLVGARHLEDFIRVGYGNDADRDAICRHLCDGLARLEDVPAVVRRQAGAVPLRIATKTPTETAFWITKALERFALTTETVPRVEGFGTLHTHVKLTYRFDAGHEEPLALGAELFETLMELKHGYQLSHVGADEVFANLAIFRQRLAQEGDRSLYAWNPVDGVTYSVRAGAGCPQEIVIEPVGREGPPCQ